MQRWWFRGDFTILLRIRKEETARPTSGSSTGLEEQQLPSVLGREHRFVPSTEPCWVVTSLLFSIPIYSISSQSLCWSLSLARADMFAAGSKGVWSSKSPTFEV